MGLLNTISYINIKDADSVAKYLQGVGCKVYKIDGNKISNMEELFGWIKEKFPQDPPLSGNVNFDALVDSLWGGFDGQCEEKVAIIWTNPTELMEQDKVRFDVLIECIDELAKTLSLDSYGVDKHISLKTILLGEGSLFSRFSI